MNGLWSRFVSLVGRLLSTELTCRHDWRCTDPFDLTDTMQHSRICWCYRCGKRVEEKW